MTTSAASLTTTTRTMYTATVWHGGSLLGLGRWGITRRVSCPIRAAAAGRRMADACRRTVGGSPTVEIESQAARRALRAAVGDRFLRWATADECRLSDGSSATAGIVCCLVRGVRVDAYADSR